MKKENGFVLIVALLITAVVAILVFGTAFTSLVDRQISSNKKGADVAYYTALAGVEKYKALAFQTFRYYLENTDAYSEELSVGNPTCGNLFGIGLDLNRDGVMDASDLAVNGTLSDKVDGQDYDVTFSVDGKHVFLKAVSNVGRSRSTVQLVAQAKNSGIFSNAIFVGNGQANKHLNGGAEIFGSVTVMGDDPNTNVISANGDFNMHNSYTKTQIADLLKTSPVNVEDFLNLKAHEQKDLCARLRVKNGKVALSGSSSLGDPVDSSTPDFSKSLAGINVGNNGDNTDITTSGSATIYADEKADFDLDGLTPPLKLPKLDELANCPDVGTNQTWRECMSKSASLTLTAGSTTNPQGVPCDLAGNGFITGLQSDQMLADSYFGKLIRTCIHDEAATY